MKGIKRVIDAVLDSLFPTGVTCLYCDKEINDDINGLCFECASAMEQNEKFDASYGERTIYSAFSYNGLARKIILRAKDSDAPHLTRPMAKYIAELYKIIGKGCDCIAYVPCSKSNLRKRGYDHMKHTATFLSEELELPVANALKRVGKAHDQTDVNIEDRKRNVENAFVCDKKEKIIGKRVLLIDDLVTTGATMNACAAALSQANPKEILCFTFARA